MLEHIFELVAPHLCVACQKEGSILCSDCIAALPAEPVHCYICGRNQKHSGRICRACRRSTALDAVVVVAHYEGAAKQLVQRLKFERASAATGVIARLMARKLTALPPHTLIVHAPTATKRVRSRGYDQSRLIAKHVARELSLPYRSLLVRKGQSRQLGANKQHRQEQMEHAFAALKPLPPNTPIVLVDDVLTTGATLEAAAAALKQAGAGEVIAVVFAAA